MAERRLLAELLGQWEEAAHEWVVLGDVAKAADCYRLAGQPGEAARLLESEGRFAEAAEDYREGALLSDAGRCFAKAGDLEGAWELLRGSDPAAGALDLYERLKANPNLALSPKTSQEVADTLEEQGELAGVARFYEMAGRLEKAGSLLEAMGAFEPALALYDRAGQHLAKARLLERMERYADAAEANQEAAAELRSRDASGDEVAQPLLAASACYARAGMVAEARTAEEEGLKAGSVPRLDVLLSSEEPLRLDEWGSVDVQLRNRGYGMANDVQLMIRGPLAYPVSHSVGELPPRAQERVGLSLRPVEAGRVPLEVEIHYLDPSGEAREESVRVHVPVLRPGESERPQVSQFFYQSTIHSLAQGVVDQSSGKTEQGAVRVDGDVGMIKQPQAREARPFRACPYCGETLDLPKTPRFCPYCGETLTQ